MKIGYGEGVSSSLSLSRALQRCGVGPSLFTFDMDAEALLPLLWKQWRMFLLLLSSQTFRVHCLMLLVSWRLCNYLRKAPDLDQALPVAVTRSPDDSEDEYALGRSDSLPGRIATRTSSITSNF